MAVSCRLDAARKLQIGDIGTSNQKHQPYRGEQDQQRLTIVAHNMALQRLNSYALVIGKIAAECS
jgi:hypothetical protein